MVVGMREDALSRPRDLSATIVGPSQIYSMYDISSPNTLGVFKNATVPTLSVTSSLERSIINSKSQRVSKP